MERWLLYGGLLRFGSRGTIPVNSVGSTFRAVRASYRPEDDISTT